MLNRPIRPDESSSIAGGTGALAAATSTLKAPSLKSHPAHPRILATNIPGSALKVNPNVAKAGGFQSQGAEGDTVVLYCNPLATRDLESSRFPERVKT